MARWPRFSDLLTTANLISGVASILFSIHGELTIACWLIFAGALFDVFDGLAARAFGGGSEFGKQLDSLADMVTFGVSPGILVYFTYAEHNWRSYLWDVDQADVPTGVDVGQPIWLSIMLVVITIASAWRLAKFNIDTRQTTGFLGLPTPSNGLFWTSVVMSHIDFGTQNGPGAENIQRILSVLITQSWLTLIVSILLGFFMLSELPLPGLKFKHFRWKGNEVVVTLAIAGLVLAILYGIMAVPLIILLYLTSPGWGRIFGRADHAGS